jgi:translation initiation factor 5B
MIRQPIISVLGHVDHGKTSLLDRIRSTAIASKEAGGITQHIGASEVPIDVVNRICGSLKSFDEKSLHIPGLLFIDTPGHEAFTNLRRRGGSIADLAVLVIDVNDGVQPQTAEAIEILREYKTPFIIAGNKIDTISGWISSGSYSVTDALSRQSSDVRDRLTTKIFELIGGISKFGIQSNLFNEITNFQKEVAIVPVSAVGGEGIAELLMLVSGLSQRYLGSELEIDMGRPGKGGILEKKEVRGLGTVIDVILYDGTLRVNDIIAFATEDEGVETAKIRALLKPKPLREIRESSNEFRYIDSVSAASGVRVSAVGLERALVGSTVIDSRDPEYITNIKAELSGLFKRGERGPVLKADSIGGIEALSKIFESEGIPISKKGIGNVSKRDILDAFAMNAVNRAYVTVLAFNVNVDPDAKAAAEASGVQIIQQRIIYRIVEDYKALIGRLDKVRVDEAMRSMVLPGKIMVMQNSCFRVSHPAIFGVEILAGTIRPGYTLINSSGNRIGRIKGIQNEKSSLSEAKKGDEIAISMDEPTFGRQIKGAQVLYTRVGLRDAYLLKGEFSKLLSDEELELVDEILSIKSVDQAEP